MTKIVECCKEITNSWNNIELTDKSSEISIGKVVYWTGEEQYARDIEIKYCPFCGKKIELVE